MTCPEDRAGYRQMLAVLGKDATIAQAAADLARREQARLSIVQTWQAPLSFCALGHPFWISTGMSLEALHDAIAAEAEARLRTVLRELDHDGPLAFRCCRGRPDVFAFRALRSGAYDAVVVADTPALRCSRLVRALLGSSVAAVRRRRGGLGGIEPPIVLALRS